MLALFIVKVRQENRSARLCDRLGATNNSDEMFRIFSCIKTLLVRPRILNAVREYQTQLITAVEDDIECLRLTFTIEYPQSKVCRISHTRSLPLVLDSIIWTLDTERQLNNYMQCIEDVLGKGWENHMEEQKLKADGDSLCVKLNMQQLLEDWSARVSNDTTQLILFICALRPQMSWKVFDKDCYAVEAY